MMTDDYARKTHLIKKKEVGYTNIEIVLGVHVEFTILKLQNCFSTTLMTCKCLTNIPVRV
jgi:hypothetical protein